MPTLQHTATLVCEEGAWRVEKGQTWSKGSSRGVVAPDVQQLIHHIISVSLPTKQPAARRPFLRATLEAARKAPLASLMKGLKGLKGLQGVLAVAAGHNLSGRWGGGLLITRRRHRRAEGKHNKQRDGKQHKPHITCAMPTRA